MIRMRYLGIFLVGIFLLAGIIQSAPAHENRMVGNYVIEFGWQIEPAYVGQFNGSEITITEMISEEAGHDAEHDDADHGDDDHAAAEDEHDHGKPVIGAEDTLQLEVSFGNVSRVLHLRPGDEPGHYIAHLIPTRPGDYTFRLNGTLGETEIDETFTSAAGDFSTVEPASDILFPDEDLPSLQDLQAQIDELRALIEALQSAQ